MHDSATVAVGPAHRPHIGIQRRKNDNCAIRFYLTQASTVSGRFETHWNSLSPRPLLAI